MKNLKIISLTIIFTLFFSITSFAGTGLKTSTISKLNDFKLTEGTESEEIDPYDIITFPSFTYNDSIKITVDNSKIGSYKFFYQTIDLTDSQHTAIDNARNNYTNDVSAINQQIKNENEELKAEQEKCIELQQAYNEAYAKDPNSEETKAAKQKYDDALTAYSTHRDQAYAYIEEQTNILKQKLEDLRALYPKYDDSKWISSENDTASYSKQVTQKTYFALWIKVETTTKTYYAVADYSQNATTPEPDPDPEPNPNPNPEEPEETPEKLPTILPDAGSSIITFTVIATISIIGGYCYVRYNTIDK